MAAFNDTETFVSVILLGDQEFLNLVFVRSPISSRNVEVIVKFPFFSIIVENFENMSWNFQFLSEI